MPASGRVVALPDKWFETDFPLVRSARLSRPDPYCFFPLPVSPSRLASLAACVILRPDNVESRPIHLPMTRIMVLLELALVFLVVGCGIFPENVSVSDKRVQSLLKAAANFDRLSYGFSPLPTSGRVSLESKPRSGYDAMLHLGGKTSRTIAFRKNTSDYFWIGEQEIFEGPQMYKSVDGAFHEEVTLTFEKEHVSGVLLNELNVSYRGEDPRLAGRVNLTLRETLSPSSRNGDTRISP